MKTFKGRGPIARKVISTTKKHLQRSVVGLSAWKEAKTMSLDYQESIISDDKLKEYDPLHALYIDSQNKLSVLIEQITEHPALHKMVTKYVDAEDLYLPSYPPMSPLTKTYFSSWGFFDLCSEGIQKETFGTVITDFCKFVDVDPSQIEIFEEWQKSYMGIYKHEGVSDTRILLREMITNREIEVISPAGYMGKKGEIWFVRVLPPLFHSFDYSVIFTTPYVLGKMIEGVGFMAFVEDDWLAYFERTLGKTGRTTRKEAYYALMKYGLDTNYWNEYIFFSFVHYTNNVIYLAGTPDIHGSLPHAE